MREKLIELLERINGCCPKEDDCYHCKYEALDDCSVYAKADFLIANGVTLDNQVASSKWISVKDRLPKNRQDVLVVAFLRDCWNVCLGWYAPNGKVWHVGFLEETCYPVSHWMPLPQPPKGE
jgi:hypothetical protein